MARYFMGDTRRPMRAQRSGSHGERRSRAVSEPCRLRRGEGYGACDDELSVFRAAEWETRDCLFSESRSKPFGASKIL